MLHCTMFSILALSLWTTQFSSNVLLPSIFIGLNVLQRNISSQFAFAGLTVNTETPLVDNSKIFCGEIRLGVFWTDFQLKVKERDRSESNLSENVLR